MTIGSTAYLQIAWIDMVFNTSGPPTGYEARGLKDSSGSCSKICAVDGIQQPGFPEVRYSASAAVAHSVGNSWLSLTWALPLLFAILGVQANF
jgi:hypothetical protein